MFTTPFKVTIATILGVAVAGGLFINQTYLANKVSLLEKSTTVVITPVPTVTTIPTATPSAAIKYIPIIKLVQPTSHVVK